MSRTYRHARDWMLNRYWFSDDFWERRLIRLKEHARPVLRDGAFSRYSKGMRREKTNSHRARRREDKMLLRRFGEQPIARWDYEWLD